MNFCALKHTRYCVVSLNNRKVCLISASLQSKNRVVMMELPVAARLGETPA